MVLIPGGPFEMGAAGTQALEDERPLHRVTLDAFMMDVYEVTTAQYGVFLSATGRVAPWMWEIVSATQHSDRPVIGVDWNDADAYCRWKG